MNTLSRQNQLESLVNISNQMLLLAQQSQWDDLPELETQRQDFMYQVFENKNMDGIKNIVDIEQSISEILSINQQIECLAQQNKKEIKQQFSGLKKQHHVHSAYLQNK